jgi:hypothetical protein
MKARQKECEVGMLFDLFPRQAWPENYDELTSNLAVRDQHVVSRVLKLDAAVQQHDSPDDMIDGPGIWRDISLDRPNVEKNSSTMAAPRGANDPYAIYIILCFSRNQSSL